MDISSIGSLTSALSSSQTVDAASTFALKKAMDIQSQSVQQLIQAIPQPSNPPNLGNSIDVKA